MSDMVMHDPPYCAICGGPFEHIELLNFAELKEDDQYLENCAYDSQLLSPAQSAWSARFRILAYSDPDIPYPIRNLSSNPDIFISAEGDWQPNEDWLDLAPGWTCSNAEDGTREERTGFGDFFTTHSACMKILNIFIQHRSRLCSPRSPKTMQEFLDIYSNRLNEVTNYEGVPSNWALFQNFEHSHLYFGARRFWTDPWDCEPGSEYLCADPIHEPGIETFVSTCLTHASSSPSSEQLALSTSSSGNKFMGLPREILDLIISRLPLRDALSLCSSSRKLLGLTDSSFWRSQTVQAHSCWFWELQDLSRSSSNENWKVLLQTLTSSRFQIEQGAEPFWLNEPTSKSGGTKDRSVGLAEAALFPLPLGLRNRQRIWMCLESVGTKAEWELQHVRPKMSKSKIRRTTKKMIDALRKTSG